MYELTCLKVKSMSLYGVFSGPELHYVYPHGDEVYNIDTVYICNEFEGELVADTSEVTALKWFPFNELPENLSPPVKEIINKFVNEKLSEKKTKL